MDNQKMSDFGSAKILVCSRLYRAPELFAKYELYGCAVDIWSAGCVLAELLKGSPLFASPKHDRKQLRFIVNMLGAEGLERAPEVLSKLGTDPKLWIMLSPLHLSQAEEELPAVAAFEDVLEISGHADLY